ncbi:MAG: hypothetical protein ACE5OR_16040, partial [bacterium]
SPKDETGPVRYGVISRGGYRNLNSNAFGCGFAALRLCGRICRFEKVVDKTTKVHIFMASFRVLRLPFEGIWKLTVLTSGH